MTGKPTLLREMITHGAEETEQAGERLARNLGPGDVVALSGDLGAGKTCLVRGLARGLGCRPAVASPTFTLLHEYPGRIPLYHFDLYRLKTPAELEDLGCDEYFYGDGVCVLEWAEKSGSLLPARHWEVRFEILDDSTRRLRIEPPRQKG